MPRRHRIFILVYWIIFILILISFPMNDYHGTKVTYYDKVVHIFLFGVFVYLLNYVLIARRRPWFLKLFLITTSVGFFFSALCEFIQIYVPGRDVSTLDFTAGSIGVLLAEIITYVRYYRKT